MTKFVGTLNIPSLASAPATAQEGDLYYNTSTDKVNFYNGAAWTEVGGGGGNTVYYQTSAPGSANTGDIWIDSDSVLGGPIELTNSPNSTSISTAATPNSVLQSMKNYQTAAYNSTTRIGNMPHFVPSTTTSWSSGQVAYTRLIAERNFSVTNIGFISTAVASSGLTLCRFGIYTRSGTTFTLVARTASDTTIFNVANTRFTRALDTTGGYPATYDFVAGNEYWLAFIQVGTTRGETLVAASMSVASQTATGTLSYSQSSQTDLPTSGTGGSLIVRLYAEVS
jgi:hypothetical protein